MRNSAPPELPGIDRGIGLMKELKSEIPTFVPAPDPRQIPLVPVCPTPKDCRSRAPDPDLHLVAIRVRYCGSVSPPVSTFRIARSVCCLPAGFRIELPTSASTIRMVSGTLDHRKLSRFSPSGRTIHPQEPSDFQPFARLYTDPRNHRKKNRRKNGSLNNGVRRARVAERPSGKNIHNRRGGLLPSVQKRNITLLRALRYGALRMNVEPRQHPNRDARRTKKPMSLKITSWA